MIELTFWLSVVLIVYTYVGFPALVLLRSRFRNRPHRREEIYPAVTIVIAAHNEAKVIAKKLDNLLGLDYPREKLNIIVASDGSDDGTNQIVRNYEARGIRLLALERQGKIPTLNTAVSHADSEILVFSDANSMYDKNAIRALVSSFADPAVGGVAGNQTYVSETGDGATGLGERLYWNFDQLLKKLQSRAGNTISATGAIYAIRRKLFEPVPSGACDDAVITHRVVAKGFRLVYEPTAVAYETVAPSAGAEFMRKVRVCVRGFRALMAEPRLFNPFRYGFYSVQLISHKLLRRLQIWPLLLMFLASLLLISKGEFYKTAAMIQILFYGLAFVAFLLRDKSISTSKIFGILAVPFYFCMVNVATLIAQWRVLQGERIESWDVNRTIK